MIYLYTSTFIFIFFSVFLILRFIKERKNKKNLQQEIEYKNLEIKSLIRELNLLNNKADDISEIEQIDIFDIHPVFETNQFGPTLKSEVIFLGRGDIIVPGGTSDTEAWILSVMAKISKNIFEFGTCTGKTSYLFARNSVPEASVVTITLAPEELSDYHHYIGDSELARKYAIEESEFNSFIYTGTESENKIKQLFGDSKDFDENQYNNEFDLIFIDGSHTYSYIKSDTEKALKMLKRGGFILWHDYRGPDHITKDVFRYLNELKLSLPVKLIKGTTLAIYQKV